MASYFSLTDDYTRDDIELAFGDLVQGVTGLTRDLIRPLWQPDMPQQPDISVNWCAFGVEDENPVYMPIMDMDNNGGTAMSSISFFDMYIVFYGVDGFKLCTRLRDSLFLATNRDTLRGMGVLIKNPSAIKRIPELVNNRWYDRCDMRVHMTRSTRRKTTIPTIISGSVTLRNDIIK